jgi:hypothetical protein
LQSRDAPLQLPSLQESSAVQKSPSLHADPFGSFAVQV